MHELIGRSGYDNAFAESFFGRFKNEVLQGGIFLDLDDAQREIFEFIEMDYNRTRKHCALSQPLQIIYLALYQFHIGT
jgi:transposase InsO family protein